MILHASLVTNRIKAAEDMRSRLNILVGECMAEHKEEIIALLIHQQYVEGIDSSGKPLRQYAPSYVQDKTAMGLYRGFTDLNLTGEFHGGLNLVVDGEQYTFDSPALTDRGELKSEWLTRWNKAKGGAEIMELTPENKKAVWEIILPTFREKSANEITG